MKPGLRSLAWLFGGIRRPEPIPPRTRIRECLLHGCYEPAMRDGFLCQPHEMAEKLDYYHPLDGWVQP